VINARLIEGLALYLVADNEQTGGDFLTDVGDALAGGVTCVQLRTKALADLLVWALARAVRTMCDETSALFIVNDRVDIALAVGADGVHLGVNDLPLEAAREVAGPDFVIGYSPDTDEQAAAAKARGADYLGVGPIYGTRSKSDAGEPIGLEVLKRRVRIAGVPVVGIGGITNARAGAVIEAGAVGVAVVSAILQAEQPYESAHELSNTIHSSLRRR
jgi:thiamine-phosphate pyrophosphorylase